MKNAFSLLSRQAIFKECATYISHNCFHGSPTAIGTIHCCGIHLDRSARNAECSRVTPRSLVPSRSWYQPLVQMMNALTYSYRPWCMDDGVLAGNHLAILSAVQLIEELVPALGIHVNFSKCELFSRTGNTSFPPSVKCSLLPNPDILRGPIGDYLYCSKFIVDKCVESKQLLSGLTEVAKVDLHVAVTLLRMCGSFCRMVHIARVTPPSLVSDGLKNCDEGVRNCFMLSH